MLSKGNKTKTDHNRESSWVSNKQDCIQHMMAVMYKEKEKCPS